ncbi:MAG: HPr family phosphocarrier protein [Oscillospiraceae bacterium]|nr:HPr family phosphocarrier protein [Oscillospiraceae bacterium]
MQKFIYKITDEVGIHARPAGYLAKKTKEFESVVTIEKNGKKAVASKLMAVMSLGVEQGDEVTVTVEGNDEEKASAEMKKFFEENL